jgi:hypothetical protein
VARGLADAARRGDAAGLARAGAIVAGLSITTLGYAVGRARRFTPDPEATRAAGRKLAAGTGAANA